jgi:ferritin-like metal-binding protein YciE
MQLPARPFLSSQRPGNLGSAERWLSAIAGVGLLLSATRGGTVGRLARGGAALSLLTRASTGYCAVKSALRGDSTLQDGLRQQWQRLTESVAAQSVVERIDSMDRLYALELQELHSAETQLCALSNRLVPIVSNGPLAFRLQEYATELQSRRADLESLLARTGIDAREHSDDAMEALVVETNKMARVCAESVRDAAVAASLQRIIHYKIAGYGTIASYAKALGRHEQAGHFAQLADRDKAIDTELTELAKATLNQHATQGIRIESTPIITH